MSGVWMLSVMHQLIQPLGRCPVSFDRVERRSDEAALPVRCHVDHQALVVVAKRPAIPSFVRFGGDDLVVFPATSVEMGGGAEAVPVHRGHQAPDPTRP
jgi:hypothetical protein